MRSSQRFTEPCHKKKVGMQLFQLNCIVYFIISPQNIHCGNSLEVPQRGILNIYFVEKYGKLIVDTTSVLEGVVGWCEGAVYLTSLGRPTDIGLQLGKACYPCSG